MNINERCGWRAQLAGKHFECRLPREHEGECEWTEQREKP